jgi:hypothetical protein
MVRFPVEGGAVPLRRASAPYERPVRTLLWCGSRWEGGAVPLRSRPHRMSVL